MSNLDKHIRVEPPAKDSILAKTTALIHIGAWCPSASELGDSRCPSLDISDGRD